MSLCPHILFPWFIFIHNFLSFYCFTDGSGSPLNSNLVVSKTTYSWGTLYRYDKIRVLEIFGFITVASNTPLVTFAVADRPIDTFISSLSCGQPYALAAARVGSNGELTLRDSTDAPVPWSNVGFRGQLVWFTA